MEVAACASSIAAAKKKNNAAVGASSPSVLLVTHGSRVGADPAVAKLVEALSADFSEVTCAVLRGRPCPQEVLADMTGSPVHVLPLLMACGDVSDSLFASLSRPGEVERLRLRFHAPIGAHPRLAAIICRRIRRIIDQYRLAPRDAAVLLVGHGSGRNPASGAAIRRLAGLVRAQDCGVAEVHSAFLAEPPHVEDWQALTRRRNVIVIPCLLTAGMHVRFDLPALLRSNQARRTVLMGKRRLFVAPHLTAETHGLADLVRDAVLGRFPASVAAA